VTRILIIFCFYLSGAAGLIYQVLWTRILIPVVGATLYSVATVLAAFMAGLALGSWVGGRAIDRWPGAPLKVYAVLELLIAVSAGLVPLMVAPLGGLGRGGLVGAFLVLLLPTFFMGATLPVLTKLVTEDLECLGERVGQLYSANTSGAVVGALAAGYVMVPVWGIAKSLYLAVGLNLVVALLAFVMPRMERQGAEQTPMASKPAPWRKAALWAFAFSGMTALAFEVIWTRALSQVLGTSVYAFSTMLIVFLIGIAAGSGIMGARAHKISRPEVALGVLLVGTGLAGLVGARGLAGLPQALFWAGPHLTGFGSYLGLHLILATVILLPQTMFFGATLPIVTRLVTPSLDRVGTQLGKAYFFNTSGAILGSLLGGFFLVPSLGPLVAAYALAGLNVIVGAVWLVWTGARRTGVLGLLAALVLAIGLGRTDPTDGLFAAYSKPNTLGRQTYQESRRWARKSEVLFQGYGLHSTVVVSQSDEIRSLSLDGWVVASTNSGDRFIEQALGLLPLLLVDQPESVLVVGLGTGITAGAAASGSAQDVQVVELEAQVVAACELFNRWNGNVSVNPAVRITVDDGRRYLSTVVSGFDIITSDPIHPFSRGSASLYTVEHFKACRDKLKPDGVMVQWLPLYGLESQDIQIVTRSFMEAFPNASLWCWYPSLGREDTILVGVNGDFKLDLESIRQRLGGLSGSEVPWERAEEVVAGYLMEGPALEEFAGAVLPNTDDRPILEFTAPISLFQRSDAGAGELTQAIIKESGSEVPRLELDLESRKSLGQEFRRNGRASKSDRLLLEAGGKPGPS
jgi:spermidine synthase